MNSSAPSVIVLWRVLALGPVVLPAEGDAALVQRDQPAVGDGHPVRVARQVGQHRLRPGERALGIDHPLALAQRRQPAPERLGVGQRRVLAEELQLAGLMHPQQLFEEAPPEQPREHPHRQEEARPAGDPASCRRATARRRARCRARADGASAPSPRCAAPAWRRCARPGAWDRRRWSAASRRPRRTAGHRSRPCSGTRCRRSAPAA